MIVLKGKEKYPVIITGRDADTREIITKAVTMVTKDSTAFRFTKDIEATHLEFRNIFGVGEEVDLIVTDLFIAKKINIFSLINMLEETPNYRNTPLLIYTSKVDVEIFNRLRRSIKHLPFRVMTQPLREKKLAEACAGLIEYRRDNRYTLQLEAKLSSLAQVRDTALIPGALNIIDEYAKKHPLAFHYAKTNLVKGKLYYQFCKQNIEEIEKIGVDKEGLTEANKKLDALVEENKGHVKIAEKFFLSSHRRAPRFWETLSSLYDLYIDHGNAGEAKKYLGKLIEIFPEESQYAFKMGKIQELEGNYQKAMSSYLGAWKKHTDDKDSEHSLKDVMEIIDASLESSQRMLKDMKLSQFTTNNQDVTSSEYQLVRALKQHNAMTRSALVGIAKENPQNADVFNKIGITYRRTGDYAMAVKMYAKALELEPKNYRIRINHSVAKALHGAWDDAKAEMIKAQGDDKKNEDKKIIETLLQVITDRKKQTLAKLLV